MCEDGFLYPRYSLIHVCELALKEISICPNFSVKCCSLVSSLLQIHMQLSGHFFQGNLFKTCNSRSFLRDNLSELGVLNQIFTLFSQRKENLSVSQEGKTETKLQQNCVSYLSTGRRLEFGFCYRSESQRNSNRRCWRKCFHAPGFSVLKLKSKSLEGSFTPEQWDMVSVKIFAEFKFLSCREKYHFIPWHGWFGYCIWIKHCSSTFTCSISQSAEWK